MIRKFVFLCFLMLAFASAFAQVGSPLPVNPSTIGLWSFDEDTGDTVKDLASNPIDGTAFATMHLAIPNIHSSFSFARKFTNGSSFIDLGTTSGTKLDFGGFTSLSIEAVISLSAVANDNHMIFESNQAQFMIINNKLAGFVRQSGGLLGVVSTTSITLNTPYRVSMILGNDSLALFINGKQVGSVAIHEPIGASTNLSSHATIGGDVYQMYFPGYIDDLRISDDATLDNIAPEVNIISPDLSNVITNATPDFIIELSDQGEGVDASSVSIFYNDVPQLGFQVSASRITGRLDQPLISDSDNFLKIVVKDYAGNQKVFLHNIRFQSVLGKSEYISDDFTLMLYHMNDYSDDYMEDASKFARHAFNNYSNNADSYPVEGVFGRGRLFNGNVYGEMTAPPLSLSSNKFTFETWMRPESTSTGVIFSSPHFTISKQGDGFIRIQITKASENHDFTTFYNDFKAGELHHLAVVYNGASKTSNLRVYKDGELIQSFDVASYCDFNKTPALVKIGESFRGMLDEMRISSIARSGFNILTQKEVGIFFKSLADRSSVKTAYPVLNVEINSLIGFTVDRVKLFLNSIQQSPSSKLVFDETGIKGVMANALVPGINYIKVEMLDNEMNQKIQEIAVFYIDVRPLKLNVVDEKTVIQFDFDRDGKPIDVSNNQYKLTASSSFVSTDGVIGSGAKSATISTEHGVVDLKNREITIEGFFRSNQEITKATSNLVSISGSNTSINLVSNNYTGTVSISFSSQTGGCSADVAMGLPVDGNYHHVALVYDPTRDFSQLLYLLDGSVLKAIDFDCHCDPRDLSTISFNLENWSIDQFRVRNEALYFYNISTSGNPVIKEILPSPGSFVATSSVSAHYRFMGMSGIDVENTRVLVNGVLQELDSVTAGNEFTLSGNLRGTRIGGNDVDIIVRDVNGVEERKIYQFYIAEMQPKGEYQNDENTLALYHFNEGSGSLIVDSSNNHFDINTSGVDFSVPGLSGTTGAKFLNGQYTPVYTSLVANLNDYTIEAWLKPSSPSMNLSLLSIGSWRLEISGTKLSVYGADGSLLTEILDYFADNESSFSHLAVISDSSSASNNFFILKNGVLLRGLNIPFAKRQISSSYYYFMYGSPYDLEVDEFRFSKVARYQFKNN